MGKGGSQCDLDPLSGTSDLWTMMVRAREPPCLRPPSARARAMHAHHPPTGCTRHPAP